MSEGSPWMGHVKLAANGAKPASGEVVLSARGLVKRYGAFAALDGLDLDVRRGEIFGVIGPNGAGKTTTLKILSGLLTRTSGEARVLGFDVSDPAMKARLGYLPEESPLYDDMTPRTYLALFAELFAVPKKEAKARIESLLDDLALDHRDRKLGDMSKGMRRKVAIARSLVNDPDLLIYDEPASGLDPVASAHVLEIVQRVRDRGKTVIFSAHNLYHVERICDRIVLLHKGKPALSGTMKEIRARVGGTEYAVRLSVEVPGSTPAEDGGYEARVKSFDEVRPLEEAARAAGGRLLDVKNVDVPLEEIFLRTTRG
ncbi:MAG TPA: ABC transporter ATP-binding protein [Candidatus Thermoplasmatota archaeon]|nr:ABC transporter ATP-binding protein [Candidatus Thermoplasmatota archaeon]